MDPTAKTVLLVNFLLLMDLHVLVDVPLVNPLLLVVLHHATVRTVLLVLILLLLDLHV